LVSAVRLISLRAITLMLLFFTQTMIGILLALVRIIGFITF